MINRIFSGGVFRLAFVSVISLLVAQPVYAARFSNKSVKGCYVASMQGQALPNPQDPSLQLPHSSVLRFCANGKGKGTVIATWNIGGVCILGQKGRVGYSIAANGTGEAIASVTNAKVSPGCAFVQPPVMKNSKAAFGFAVMIDSGGCMEMIGTELITDSESNPVRLQIVSQGRACKQK